MSSDRDKYLKYKSKYVDLKHTLSYLNKQFGGLAQKGGVMLSFEESPKRVSQNDIRESDNINEDFYGPWTKADTEYGSIVYKEKMSTKPVQVQKQTILNELSLKYKLAPEGTRLSATDYDKFPQDLKDAFVWTPVSSYQGIYEYIKGPSKDVQKSRDEQAKTDLINKIRNGPSGMEINMDQYDKLPSDLKMQFKPYYWRNEHVGWRKF